MLFQRSTFIFTITVSIRDSFLEAYQSADALWYAEVPSYDYQLFLHAFIYAPLRTEAHCNKKVLALRARAVFSVISVVK